MLDKPMADGRPVSMWMGYLNLALALIWLVIAIPFDDWFPIVAVAAFLGLAALSFMRAHRSRPPKSQREAC